MRLKVKNPEANRLARLLAKETRETITAAVTQALRERLEAVRQRKRSKKLATSRAIDKGSALKLPTDV